MSDNFEKNLEFNNPGAANDDIVLAATPILGINLQNTGSAIDVTNEQGQTDRLGKLIRSVIALSPIGSDESIVADCCIQLLQAFNQGKNLQVTTPYGQMFDTGWTAIQLAGL